PSRRWLRPALSTLGLVAIGAGVITVLVARADPDDAPSAHRARSEAAQSASPSPSHAKATPATVGPPAPPPRPPGPIPGYLLIADRGNDRMLLVDGRKRILWTYPKPGSTPALPFNFDDDTFFGPQFDRIISNQEEQQTIQVISFP